MSYYLDFERPVQDLDEQISEIQALGKIDESDQEDIDKLRRVLRLTRDLGVNLAGVEVILSMREKMEQMQEMMEQLMYYIQTELQKKEADEKFYTSKANALVKVSEKGIVVRSEND